MKTSKNTIHIQKGCAIMDLDFELDDSREKEKNIMTLHVNDITLEIPEELLEERMRLLHFADRQKNIDDIIKKHNIFIKCYIRNNGQYDKGYNEKFLDYLNNELDIFK